MVLDSRYFEIVEWLIEGLESRFEKYTKKQLYDELLFLHEVRTGYDRTHIDSLIGLNGKRKMWLSWKRSDYINAIALFELCKYDGMFEYWIWQNESVNGRMPYAH